METFNRDEIKFLNLKKEFRKTSIKDITLDNPLINKEILVNPIIEKLSKVILEARKNKKPIIFCFGAHLIKNGLAPLMIKFIEKSYVTHLATNGASAIHDWEFSYLGCTEEDVRANVKIGQFGIWEETCKFINLAIISRAHNNLGYGESIGKMISENKLTIPKDLSSNLKIRLSKRNISSGELPINHPFKGSSLFSAAYNNKIPITVHPGFGYDIIYTHPLSDGASIGICAEIDFLRFVSSISKLVGGVYISIGSAIMSPMIFEKSLSMARNVSLQQGRNINDFSIYVNDIQDNDWDWNSKTEPPKDNPSYYLKFCKTFSRMGARELQYIKMNNIEFLKGLYFLLENNKNEK